MPKRRAWQFEADAYDDEFIHVQKWYAVCMARKLVAGPQDNHGILVVPLLQSRERSDDDIHSVIFGDERGTLVSRSNSPALVKQIAAHLGRQYGGWLAPQRADELATRLEQVRDLFEHPDRPVLDLYPPDFNVRVFLIRAFQEAMTMLRAGATRALALRIVTRC